MIKKNLCLIQIKKKAYFVFRKDNGNKVPLLTDYIKRGSDLDPCLFSKIKKGSLLYHSYLEFVISAENELNSEESTHLNVLHKNNLFINLMTFLETLLPAKRIEEWCILDFLFKNPSSQISVSELQDLMKKYVDYENIQNLRHACRVLSGEFWDSNEHKHYDSIRFNFSSDLISLNENVKSLFKTQDNVSSEYKNGCWIILNTQF